MRSTSRSWYFFWKRSRELVTNIPSLVQWEHWGKSRLMAAYIEGLMEQSNALAARLSAGGINWERMAAELVDGMLLAPNFEHSILDKLKGKPGGLSLIEVRVSLGAQKGKAKAEFDQAVLSLYKDRRVYLDRHDHPLRLSDAERRDLVFDGAGSYYVGITLRGDFD